MRPFPTNAYLNLKFIDQNSPQLYCKIYLESIESFVDYI